MSDVSINLEIGSIVPYVVDRIAALFGKDPESVDWSNRLARRTRIGMEQAQWVQCVGMAHPLAMSEIYQPIRLEAKPPADVLSLLRNNVSAVILAGPGRGKTTLLNWLAVSLAANPNFLPILFHLRTPEAVPDLLELIERLDRQRKRQSKVPLVLLVDGYDEVSIEQR